MITLVRPREIFRIGEHVSIQVLSHPDGSIELALLTDQDVNIEPDGSFCPDHRCVISSYMLPSVCNGI